MNGVCVWQVRRSGNEDMNLAMRADEEDYLDAEFIRTYKHATFPGHELLRRLEERQSRACAETIFKERVIPCVAQTVREQRLLVGHFCDFYGYRPKVDSLWFLSPWEFCMLWEVRRYTDKMNRGNLRERDQFAFPDLPGLDSLRNVWFLQRRFCPVVPAPMGTKLPRGNRDDVEEAARLYCLYMRPWTLLPEYASDHVCLLENLNVVPKSVRPRLCKKQADPNRNFATAWRWYVEGNIASYHQKRLIEQFVSICDCGAASEDVDKVQEAKEVEPVKGRTWTMRDIHSIFEVKTSGQQKRKRDKVSGSVQCAMDIGAVLWNPDRLSWEEDLAGDGHILHEPQESARASKRRKKMQDTSGSNFYLGFSVLDMAKWFDNLKNDPIQPNAEQLSFLRRVGRRLQTEAMEDFQNLPQGKRSEPRRISVVAAPGTGKSQCVKWVTSLFESVLGWEMGLQYQVLAAQNSMAALVNGTTIHSWACVPMMYDGAHQGENEDIAKMFVNCSRLRWLIIDEISCASLRLLGILERNCRRALMRNPWCLTSEHNTRLFGGLNVIMVGDYKQLPPVAERAVFANPFSAGLELTGPERRLSDALWALGPESFPDEPASCIVLETQHRTDDLWQQHVLKELRSGEESFETYCFTHGLPTEHAGSWLPNQQEVSCGNPRCQARVLICPFCKCRAMIGIGCASVLKHDFLIALGACDVRYV